MEKAVSSLLVSSFLRQFSYRGFPRCFLFGKAEQEGTPAVTVTISSVKEGKGHEY